MSIMCNLLFFVKRYFFHGSSLHITNNGVSCFEDMLVTTAKVTYSNYCLNQNCNNASNVKNLQTFFIVPQHRIYILYYINTTSLNLFLKTDKEAFLSDQCLN